MKISINTDVKIPYYIVYTILLIVVMTASTFSTTLIYKDMNDLVKESEGILVGIVEKVSSYYEDNNEIYSHIELGQLQIINGHYSGNNIVLRQYGGEIYDKNDKLVVNGAPVFEEGEKVIVFVHGNGKYKVPFVGWSQGVFKVKQDNKNGRQIIVDCYGNKVLQVKNGVILKERKFKTDTEFVRFHEGGAGKTDDGSKVDNLKYIDSDLKQTPGMEMNSFFTTIIIAQGGA